jgi:four helix bundle protein
LKIPTLDKLDAYTLAHEFKLGVYGLFDASKAAQNDFKYRSQVYDAVSSIEANIAEGWKRYGATDMSRFLIYALASLEEAKTRLQDGVDRGYFTRGSCDLVLVLGRRCGAATHGLWKSLAPFRKKT